MQALQSMSHKPAVRHWEMDSIKDVQDGLDRSLVECRAEEQPRRIQLMAARATAELIARSGELYANRDSSRFVSSFADYFVEPAYENLTFVADEVLDGVDSTTLPHIKDLYRKMGQSLTTLLLGFSPTNPLRFGVPYYGLTPPSSHPVALYDLEHPSKKRHIIHIEGSTDAQVMPNSRATNIHPLLANEATSKIWKAGDEQLPQDLVTLRALSGESLPHSDQAIGDRLLFLHDRLHSAVFNPEAVTDKAS